MESQNSSTHLWPIDIQQVQRQFSRERIMFSTNSPGTMWHIYAKTKLPLIHTSLHLQN